MGVQRPLRDCMGAMARWRAGRKVLEGTTRLWGTTPNRERMDLGELSGYHIDRPTMKGHTGGRPKGETDTTGDRLQRRSAGKAFGWWTDQSAAEQQATIARIMAETEKFVTRQKKAEAAKKREAAKKCNAAAVASAGKKKKAPG